MGAPNAGASGAIVTGKTCAISAIPDTDTARLLFLGKLATFQGQHIAVVFQQPDAARVEFEDRVMGQGGAQLNLQMSRLIFAGESRPPLIAYDDSNVKSQVNTVPCAVGFVTQAAVDDSVKVLLRY